MYEGFVQFWSLPDAVPMGSPLPVNGQGIVAADFSPNGQEVLICAQDAGRLWDVSTRKPIGPRLKEPRCLTAAFSPDGTTVTIGGKYGARIWPVPEPMKGSVQAVKERIEGLTGLKE